MTSHLTGLNYSTVVLSIAMLPYSLFATVNQRKLTNCTLHTCNTQTHTHTITQTIFLEIYMLLQKLIIAGTDNVKNDIYKTH